MTLALYTLLAAPSAGAATVPIGPPASYRGDAWPTPLRTLWVDRCGRGVAGVCASVQCADTNPGTNQNAPLCTLAAAGDRAVPGDIIRVRAGRDASDGYWEVDKVRGKWGLATLTLSSKGTATCAGGTRQGWGCTSDAGCPGSQCDYRPIVLKAHEADGPVHIDPSGRNPPELGATQCWSSNPGRYIGIDIGGPTSCGPAEYGGLRNDRTECYGGTEEGKPCAGDWQCGGGRCGARPWYWIIDGFHFTGWNYYDARLDRNDGNGTTTGNQCSEKAIQITGPRYAGCPEPVSVTVQNNTFMRNGGGGVLSAVNAAGLRYFNNTLIGNYTRGYTSIIAHWDARDAQRNRRTYMWGNVVGESYDDPPPWANPGSIPGRKICRPADVKNPPNLNCIGGDTPGAPCREETDCGWGHCGGLCAYDPYYNSAPVNQGFNCECKTEWVDWDGDPVVPLNMCAPGLACVAQRNTGGGGEPSGNTEGRGIIIDRGYTSSAVDIRNNVLYENAADCLSVFLSDGGNPTMGPGVVANNTCYHNAKKGASYGELNLTARYLDVFNNLVVPRPSATCKAGRSGGRACTTYGQWGGICGAESFGCSGSSLFQYDNIGIGMNAYAPAAPKTVRTGHDLLFVNLPGFVSNPFGVEFAPAGRGEARNTTLGAYVAYGVQAGLQRGMASLAADPLFASTDRRAADFLKVRVGSPALGAGNPAYAPPFDRLGNPRSRVAPTIGAYEVPATAGPTTTVMNTTTSTTLPPDDICDGVRSNALDPTVVRVRRFRLLRTPSGYALKAKGQLPALAGLDLGTSGLTIVVEDGAGRLLVNLKVSGSDLVGAARGWRLAAPLAGLDQLKVRVGSTATLVSVKAGLPAVELVNAGGTPDTSGALYWRLRLGSRCAHRFALACTVSARGQFRCTDG